MMKSFRHVGIFRLTLFGAVLAGFVLALALAALPELHERIHHDADQEDHQCLATTIGNGGCENAPAPPAVTAFLPVLLEIAPKDCACVVEALFLSCSVLEHAPPFIS